MARRCAIGSFYPRGFCIGVIRIYRKARYLWCANRWLAAAHLRRRRALAVWHKLLAAMNCPIPFWRARPKNILPVAGNLDGGLTAADDAMQKLLGNTLAEVESKIAAGATLKSPKTTRHCRKSPKAHDERQRMARRCAIAAAIYRIFWCANARLAAAQAAASR